MSNIIVMSIAPAAAMTVTVAGGLGRWWGEGSAWLLGPALVKGIWTTIATGWAMDRWIADADQSKKMSAVHAIGREIQQRRKLGNKPRCVRRYAGTWGEPGSDGDHRNGVLKDLERGGKWNSTGGGKSPNGGRSRMSG